MCMNVPIFIFNINNDFFGFNKISGEIIQFDSELEAKEFYNSSVTNEQHTILINTDNFKEDIENPKAIAITIELNNSCNLNCTYCYQVDKDSRDEITERTIDMVLTYVSKVYRECAYESLMLRFIGGEPLLSTDKLLLCYEKFKLFCFANQIQLYVHVDTNGTCLTSDLIRTIPNLDMVICLTEKSDHDLMRSGSYDVILRNLLSLEHEDFLPITIRYNVSHLNLGRFESFLQFIRKCLPHVSRIATARIDDSHCKHSFINQLSKYSYARWNSTTAIDLLVKYGFEINHCTRSSLMKCQGYSKYSCKIYSDGKVSVCDAMYHDEATVDIEALVNNINSLELYYDKIKRYSPLNDVECSCCSNLVQCGGKRFCRDWDEVCNYQQEYIESEFVKTYIYHYMHGNARLFVNMRQL